jgi:hypothetical protein
LRDLRPLEKRGVGGERRREDNSLLERATEDSHLTLDVRV